MFNLKFDIMEKQISKLRELGACTKAVLWAKDQPDWETAWEVCKRGDWMLWLLGKLSGGPRSKSRKKLVLVACKCARITLKHVSKGEDRPRIAIETAEAWTRGEATLSQVRSAAYAAYAAAYAADAAAYIRNESLRKSADFCREILTEEVLTAYEKIK